MAVQPDLSEFEKLSHRSQKKPCKVGAAASRLKPAERKQLDAASEADTGRISNAAILSWLEARGLDASIPSVTNHRRKQCSCYDG